MRRPRTLDAAKLSDRAMIDALRQVLGMDSLYDREADRTNEERFYQTPWSASSDRAPRHPTA